MEAKSGIWMPTAAVLCYECHGRSYPRTINDPSHGIIEVNTQISDEAWDYHTTPHEFEKGNDMTFCDLCGEAIQLNHSIANEHKLVRNFIDAGIDAEMEQTGGMNSAGRVNTEDEGYYLFTFDFEGDLKWVICRFDHNDEAVSFDPVVFYKKDHVWDYILEQHDYAERR